MLITGLVSTNKQGGQMSQDCNAKHNIRLAATCTKVAISQDQYFSQNVPGILSGIKGPLDRPEITGIEHMQY